MKNASRPARTRTVSFAALPVVLAALAVGPAIAAAQSPVGTAGTSGSTGTTGTTSSDKAPALAPVPKPAPTLSPDYRLGSGDKLRIEVYKDPQLSQSLQIRPDGKITMPLIGDVAAVGLTPLELRDRLTSALKDYVTNPVVTVIVQEAVASNIYVMGEVNKPGTLPLSGPMTVLQALAMAGGFKDFANTKDIRVLRRTPTGVDTIRFNYREAVKGQGRPIYLQSGDTIIVP